VRLIAARLIDKARKALEVLDCTVSNDQGLYFEDDDGENHSRIFGELAVMKGADGLTDPIRYRHVILGGIRIENKVEVPLFAVTRPLGSPLKELEENLTVLIVDGYSLANPPKYRKGTQLSIHFEYGLLPVTVHEVIVEERYASWYQYRLQNESGPKMTDDQLESIVSRVIKY
jgi:hypothetical protein